MGERFTRDRLSITIVGDDPDEKSTTQITTTTTPNLSGHWPGRTPTTSHIDDGILTFKSGPDFEAPTDSGRNNVYEVTVQATDEAGNTASQRVRITVENVEEVGVITLSHTQPEARARLTASLSDPDKARSVSWQWYRGSHSNVDHLPRGRFRESTDATIPLKCDADLIAD